MAWPTQQGGALITPDYDPTPPLALDGGTVKYIAFAFGQAGIYSEPTIGQIWPR